MAKYVSYYDESNWDSWVEVMNIQGERAVYRLKVYDRDGRSYYNGYRTLPSFQTERISIRTIIQNIGRKEGIIMIEPHSNNPRFEFPAMLTIRAEGQSYKASQFFPFIRVP